MENQRFIIRETEFADYEYFARWESDPQIVKDMSFDDDRTYEDVVTEGLYNKKDPSKLDFTIVKRDIGKPIGRIYISRIDKSTDSLDITKYYIGERDMWGLGLGKEVLRELLEYCFTFMHMERVTLDYYTANKKAKALYESLGFKAEGVARNAARKNGKYYDLNLMSILRSEFFGENSVDAD